MKTNKISMFIIAYLLCASSMVFGYSKWCSYEDNKDTEFYAGRASYGYIKDHTTHTGQNFVCYVNLEPRDKVTIQSVLTFMSGNTSIEIAKKKLQYTPAAQTALKVLHHFRKYKNAKTLADVLHELGMNTLEEEKRKREKILY
ncbi:hypothetical protein KC460_03835 [Candidatus Dependentiae bacterium]|nr:hypothetical protein [Candidatus Dependentiae bacterium]